MSQGDRERRIRACEETSCAEFDHIGITVAARLHRTATDLPRLLDRPGRIRLVKGSFDTPRDLALDAGSAALADRYDEYTSLLLASGHPCAIATHDIDRVPDAGVCRLRHAGVAVPVQPAGRGPVARAASDR